MVVQRAADGTVAIKDRVGTTELAGTATGGLLGLLLGVLGGPVGVLIGGYTGLLFGSLYDLDDSEQIETTLGEISKTVQPDRSAVLAVVSEQSLEVVDLAMASFGGKVLRRGVSTSRPRSPPPRSGAQGRPRSAARADAGQAGPDARVGARQGRGAQGEASHRNGEQATKQTAGATS